jgi:hypothetical protein
MEPSLGMQGECRSYVWPGYLSFDYIGITRRRVHITLARSGENLWA